MKFRLLFCFAIFFVSCTAYKFTNMAYSPKPLTEKEARNYIYEMHYAVALSKGIGMTYATGVAPKTLEITDETLKATYEIITQNTKAINSNVETRIQICFFKQIQSIYLEKNSQPSPYQIF